MTVWNTVQVGEIQRLARYLPDKSVANYLRIPIEKVASVRSRMRQCGTLKPPAHLRRDRHLELRSQPIARDPCRLCGTRGDLGCRHRGWA